MKRVFLLIVLPALLVALGFAQTPAAGGNADQTNIQGCLGGSAGNYTVAEDNTGQIFKIATSSVDLQPDLGHEVKLVGHKTSGAVGSGAADNNLAVTEVSMISEQCAAAAVAAVPAATVSTTPETVVAPGTPAAAAPPAAPASAPAESVSTPAAPADAPSATVSTPAAPAAAPAATVTTSSETGSTPAAAAAPPNPTVSTPSETVTTPPATAAAPSTTVSASSETVSTPAAAAAQTTASARHRRRSATPAAAATPVEPVSKPAAAAGVLPVAPVSTPSEAASTPAPAATTPAVTHKSGSLWLIPLVVLLLILGTLVPLLNRWRKRKLLGHTSGENLSLTQKASSTESKSDDKTDTSEIRKAA